MACAVAAGVCPGLAANPQDFPTWLDELKREAHGKGISQRTLDDSLDNIHPLDRVLELDRKQPEFTLTFRDYLTRVVNDVRVEKGKRLLEEHRHLLDEIGSKFGVQPRITALFRWHYLHEAAQAKEIPCIDGFAGNCSCD